MFPFFPQNIGGTFLAFALNKMVQSELSELRIEIHGDTHPANKAWTNVRLQSVPVERASVTGVSKPFSQHVATSPTGVRITTPDSLMLLADEQWMLFPVPTPPLLLIEPGTVRVIIVAGDELHDVGSFDCCAVRPLPLSDEERQALKSRPGALAGLGFGISCSKCGDSGRFHTRFDPTSGNVPGDMGPSIETAPEFWQCECGNIRVPLRCMKEGLHDLFRRVGPFSEANELAFAPLYEPGALDALHRQYVQVLEASAEDEEALQKFFETNPILWNFLAPVRNWRKPPVLTKYWADFALLNATMTLYLIELEKPATKLSKSGKQGGVHHELTKGLDQIRTWRREIADHRNAFLDALGLRDDDVHDIRYILVAGMAHTTPNEALELLRRDRNAADHFFCFDDFSTFLRSTALSIQNTRTYDWWKGIRYALWGRAASAKCPQIGPSRLRRLPKRVRSLVRGPMPAAPCFQTRWGHGYKPAPTSLTAR